MLSPIVDHSIKAKRPPRRGPPMSLRLYTGLTHIAAPAAALLLRRRVARGKEDPARLAERRGLASIARPSGQLLWVHAASVGETMTMLPVIRRLVERGAYVLLTTVTLTSARLAAMRLPDGAVHQFVPFDLPNAVKRFLDHWQPDMALFAEQELWPNLLQGCHERRIPTILVNARMSPRSHRRWSRMPRTIAHVLSRFDLILAQSKSDGQRLASLGARHVETPGNLKYDAPAPPADPGLLARLARALAGRPTWVAASTQRGEEELVLEAHLLARRAHPDLVLLLAPRHPERGDEVEALIHGQGLACARRSREEWPGPGTGVFLLDTIGELGLAYRQSGIAFLGGSLVVHGGQNPIEPAKLDTVVLHGAHVHNHAEVYGIIDSAGGGLLVNDADTLGRTVARLLDAPQLATAAAGKARNAVEALAGGIDRTLAALDPFLVRIALEAHA